jgi:hypothetical protein
MIVNYNSDYNDEMIDWVVKHNCTVGYPFWHNKFAMQGRLTPLGIEIFFPSDEIEILFKLTFAL